MLSPEEKTKIELEEQYRNEVLQKFRTKSKISLVESGMKILQALAIISGIWATFYAYKKQGYERAMQEKEKNEQTAKEFRKGFYTKQFEYYAEASDAVATLATEDTGTVDYVSAKKKFYRLFWGRLSIVEDSTVENRMVTFEYLLRCYEQGYNNITTKQLQTASLNLAHAASKYTINVWLEEQERKRYRR